MHETKESFDVLAVLVTAFARMMMNNHPGEQQINASLTLSSSIYKGSLHTFNIILMKAVTSAADKVKLPLISCILHRKSQTVFLQ